MTRRRIQRGDIVMLNAFPESLQVRGLETRVTLYTCHVAGLLQRAGADLLHGPRGRRVPQVLGGQLRRPQAGAGAHQVEGR